MSIRAHILGLGAFLPEKKLTNADLEKMVETSDEWIVSRTGIRERRVGSVHETCATMGLKAAQEAIQKSGIDPKTIELVICATMSPDYLTPSSAALIQSELGIEAAAYDCQAACTGFLYALKQAKAFIESGAYKTILIVASEKMSAFIDFTDRNTCVLFGDGAGAAILSSEKRGLRVDDVRIGADGSLGKLIYIPAGGSKTPTTSQTLQDGQHYLKMEGREVFKKAVRQMTQSVEESLKQVNLTHNDIAWLVPHQANLRIITAIGEALSIAPEKVFMTLEKYGNTSGSSILIALKELIDEEVVDRDDHLVLVAFGAGLTWGSGLLTKV
jgi:3-oxoacyl-[acyl-carrier-protein] synthase-3